LHHGDINSKAVYEQVNRAYVLWKEGQDPKLPLTHHGENRIPHAVKYDLKSHYRLVAYEHAGNRILLTVGTHDEVDRWLDNNRGRDFTIDNKTKKLVVLLYRQILKLLMQ
jgi:hypothetical protein